LSDPPLQLNSLFHATLGPSGGSAESFFFPPSGVFFFCPGLSSKNLFLFLVNTPLYVIWAFIRPSVMGRDSPPPSFLPPAGLVHLWPPLFPFVAVFFFPQRGLLISGVSRPFGSSGRNFFPPQTQPSFVWLLFSCWTPLALYRGVFSAATGLPLPSFCKTRWLPSSH